MSIKIMTMVFDLYPAGGGELLLALTMADFANDHGDGIWPSVSTLCHKTRQSRRTIQGLLRRQEAIGFLSCVRKSRGRKSNEWRIRLEFFANCAEFAQSAKPRKAEQVNRATDDQKPRRAPAPNPSDPPIHPPHRGGGELVYPILAAEERTAIAVTVSEVHPDTAQQIIDEVAGTIQAGAIRRSACALARELVRRAKAGTFAPELGLAVAAQRSAAAQAAAERKIAAEPRPPANPAIAVAALAAAKKITKKGGRHV